MVSVSLRRSLVLALSLVATSAGYAHAQGCSSCNRDVDLGIALAPIPDPGPISSGAHHRDELRHDEYAHREIEQAQYEHRRYESSYDDYDTDRRWDNDGRWHQDRISYRRYEDGGRWHQDGMDIDRLTSNSRYDRRWRDDRWNEDRWSDDDDIREAPAPRYSRTASRRDRYDDHHYYSGAIDVDYEAPVPDPVHLDTPRFDSYRERDRDDYGWRGESWRRTADRSDRFGGRDYDRCDTRSYGLHERWLCDDENFETPSAALVWQTMGGRY